MTPSEHFIVALLAAIPSLLIAVATLLSIILTFMKAQKIDKQTNGPVQDLVKQTQAMLKAYKASLPPMPPTPPEDVRQSE